MSTMPILEIALAPTIIILIYIFIRDKYEKEPIKILLLSVLYGFLMTFVIIQIEERLSFYMPNGGILMEAFFTSFVIAAGTEELIKYLFLYFLIWQNKNFNERFDGIVYAVFISLGFAGFENIMYVLNPTLGGMQTAVARAFIAVPGHAFFGVVMGYYFSLAKFEPEKRIQHLMCALLVPYCLHGIYDFILLSGKQILMAFFIPFMVYLWISGFRKMKRHVEMSPFKRIV